MAESHSKPKGRKSVNWLSPHPDVAMSPARSGKGMVKIIREGERYAVYLQTKDGMTSRGSFASLALAKIEADKL